MPGLVRLAVEEWAEDKKNTVAREILNFEELAIVVKHAVVSEHNLKLEFTFKEDSEGGGEPNVKKIKRGFDFGMAKLTTLITKVKHTFDLSYDDLKAKPHLIEPDDANIRMLEDEIIDTRELYKENAHKIAEKFLGTKFFPIEIRTKLWLALIDNKHKLTPKLYKYYSEVVDKKLKENETYGNSSLSRHDSNNFPKSG